MSRDEVTARQALDAYLQRQRMATEASAQGSLRENTLRELERFLPALIECPMADETKLGDLVYAEIRPSDLRAALEAFRFAPGRPRNGSPGKLPSQATVKNVVAYSRMWMKASDAALRMDRANPMLAVKTADVIGRRLREPKTYLTDDQVALLVAEVNAHYRRIVALLSETALRSGEARGLVWANVTADGFHVDLQATQDGSRRVEPKNPTSKRFVAFTTATRSILSEQRQWVIDTYGPDWVGAERPVFPTSSGRMIHASNLAHRVSEAAERCGFKASPHALRHYALKKLLRAGVPVDVVAAIAGHASTTTTTSIYSDPTATPEEKAEAMLRAFG